MDTVTESFSNFPLQVEKPELVDWDKDHVDISWQPPADDGGAPIEEYIVEKKDKVRWVPSGKSTVLLAVRSLERGADRARVADERNDSEPDGG